MSTPLIYAVLISYLLLLFGVAVWGQRAASRGKSLINSSLAYSLSLAVYCTAWTFFGSVGRATTSGLDFLTIYLGPTISAATWLVVLRKMIVISKSQRISSIADFVSARYGKSSTLGAVATLMAIIGTIPYISLQIKAIHSCIELLGFDFNGANAVNSTFLISEPAFISTCVLAVFAIFFGTRNLDPNERHEGLISAIAFESLFKLFAFVAIGMFVVFYLFEGPLDLIQKSQADTSVAKIFSFREIGIDTQNWFWMLLLSSFAILLLPRQFHVAVVENRDLRHLKSAVWQLPLYLLVINIFVLPIAAASMLIGTTTDVDLLILNLPLIYESPVLAVLVGMGGFAAASGMVIVSTLALSIMVSNNLVIPLLIQSKTMTRDYYQDLPQRLLGIRRLAIVIMLILAYTYYKSIGSDYTLISVGLISFTAAAQFAPAVFGGMYWKGASKRGALWGLLIGFSIWAFCLPFANLVEAGYFSKEILTEGLFGWSALRPNALFGLESMSPIPHAAFWSLLLNLLAYILGSTYSKMSAIEIAQADLFVDIYKYEKNADEYDVFQREAPFQDIRALLYRFLGSQRASLVLKNFAEDYHLNLDELKVANAELVNYTETLLAGNIGAASAKIILASIVKESPIRLEEMLRVLDQTQEVISANRQLKTQQKELQATTLKLKEANEQLKELDRLKANFITTVTHELRTPITSIKSLSQIVHDNANLPREQQHQFLSIIVSECDRVTRLINQVLDYEKLALTNLEQFPPVNLLSLAENAFRSLQGQAQQNAINYTLQYQGITGNDSVLLPIKPDHFTQALINLLANALKFCASENGSVQLVLTKTAKRLEFAIIDNGIGIAADQQALIFERFVQVSSDREGKPKGSGLGLAITRRIVEKYGGTLTVESTIGAGAIFRMGFGVE